MKGMLINGLQTGKQYHKVIKRGTQSQCFCPDSADDDERGLFAVKLSLKRFSSILRLVQITQSKAKACKDVNHAKLPRDQRPAVIL